MENKKLKDMFTNLCCSNCHSDFDEDSFRILRKENPICVCQVVCQHCGKSFGLALLGYDISIKKTEPLDIIPAPLPITSNDVIDAHNFIKNLDEDWMKHIPKDFISKY